MSKTFEMIQKTLGEIEKSSVKTTGNSLTAEEIKCILLNIDSKAEIKEEIKPVETEVNVNGMESMEFKEFQLTEFNFDMESLGKYKDDCNRQFIVPYFRGIAPSWKRFNKPVIFIKKIIRKLCRSLIEPIVELQNNFNAAATNTLNALYNNAVVTQAFMNQQMMVNNQVLALLKEQEFARQNVAVLSDKICGILGKIEEVNGSVSELEFLLNKRFEMSEEDMQELLEEQKSSIVNLANEIEKTREKIQFLDNKTTEFAKKEDVGNIFEKQKGSMANLANEIRQVRERLLLLDKKTGQFIKAEEALDLLEKQDIYAKNLADNINKLDEEFQRLYEKSAEFLTVETAECLQEKQEDNIRNLAEKVEKVETEIQLFDEKTLDFLRENDVKKLIPAYMPNDTLNGYTDIDYFDFETNFRGTQRSVKERLKDYIKYYQKAGLVVDLGCGRGEFLELLEENEIEGIGVDTYDDFVEYCTNKGLNVVKEDAISYVTGLAEQSVTGIFAAQLVEHLTVNKLVDLCNEAYKKLVPGGTLIFETPNPTNLSIYYNWFYADPTHQNPVHPKTLEYLLKKAGFKEVEVIFTEQSRSGYRLPLLNAAGAENLKEFNDGINLLSDLFFGSQDYAVVARK